MKLNEEPLYWDSDKWTAFVPDDGNLVGSREVDVLGDAIPTVDWSGKRTFEKRPTKKLNFLNFLLNFASINIWFS